MTPGRKATSSLPTRIPSLIMRVRLAARPATSGLRATIETMAPSESPTTRHEFEGEDATDAERRIRPAISRGVTIREAVPDRTASRLGYPPTRICGSTASLSSGPAVIVYPPG